MQGIPRGTLLFVPTLSGVVIAKAIHQFVPNGPEKIDKNRFVDA
jgi:hypothetical protein